MKFARAVKLRPASLKDKTGMVCFESTAGTEFGTNYELRLAETYRNATVKMAAGPNGTKEPKIWKVR